MLMYVYASKACLVPMRSRIELRIKLHNTRLITKDKVHGVLLPKMVYLIGVHRPSLASRPKTSTTVQLSIVTMPVGKN